MRTFWSYWKKILILRESRNMKIMKKNSKEDQKSFISNIEKILYWNGGVRVKNSSIKKSKEFFIKTCAGKLLIYPDYDNDRIYTVFAQFKNTALANMVPALRLRINPYTGYWNFHYRSANILCSRLIAELREIKIV